MLISAISSSIRSPKTPTETVSQQQHSQNQTERNITQTNKTPAQSAQKNNSSLTPVVQKMQLARRYTILLFYRIIQQKNQSILQTTKLSSFIVTKTFLRETEARESNHSFSIFSLSFHVREIEFFSASSFYCTVVLLPVLSYHLFCKSCGTQISNFTSSSYTLHFLRRSSTEFLLPFQSAEYFHWIL